MGMGDTSIPCKRETRDRLEDIRGEEYKSWDTFLDAMADLWVQREEFMEHVRENRNEAMSYDDVRAAAKAGARAAIEEVQH